MKPIHQTIFGMPLGNCFQASVASILELPLDAVPNFNEHGDEWFEAFEEWCTQFGMYPLEISVGDYTNPLRDLKWTSGYWIAAGPGPRGISHAVVYHGDQLAHDPIPNGGGIERVEYMMVFVPLNPAQLIAMHQLQHVFAEGGVPVEEES